MMIRTLCEQITKNSSLSDAEYADLIRKIIFFVNPKYKEYDYEHLSFIWQSSPAGFYETMNAVLTYIDGKITKEEFDHETYKYWSILFQKEDEYPISHNEFDVWTIGYFSLVTKKRFHDPSLDVQNGMERLKELIPTLKDIPDALNLARQEVDLIIERTDKALTKFRK